MKSGVVIVKFEQISQNALVFSTGDFEQVNASYVASKQAVVQSCPIENLIL